jgi:hypothetical protein
VTRSHAGVERRSHHRAPRHPALSCACVAAILEAPLIEDILTRPGNPVAAA